MSRKKSQVKKKRKMKMKWTAHQIRTRQSWAKSSKDNQQRKKVDSKRKKERVEKWIKLEWNDYEKN